MCGISGVVGCGLTSVDVDNIKQITRRIENRGPDGSRVQANLESGFVLGHTRLAVIDLSNRSDQPFVDHTGTIHLVFNGEIYNHFELRVELENIGFDFDTESDTEVILKAYQAFGKEAFCKLRGMFAICLIDLSINRFFLLRDRFGIKPLYYSIVENRLYFCSSQRVVADVMDLKDLDRQEAEWFHLQGFICAPNTVTSSLKSLEGGVILSSTIDFPVEKLSRDYFSYKSRKVEKLVKLGRLDCEQSLEKLGDTIVQAVESHLVSDVPVGLFLSGGIDSSILLASINMLGKKSEVSPLSIGFDSQHGIEDETINAQKLCDQFGIPLKKKMYTQEEVIGLIDELLTDIDQPTLDGVNTWLASKFAHENGLKVVLSGLGGDEIFCGYPTFRRIPLLMRYSWLLRLLFPLADHNAVKKILNIVGLNENKIELLKSCDFSVGQLYVILRAVVSNIDKNTGFTEFLTTTASRIQNRIPEEFHSNSVLEKISNFELFYYMENQLLRDADWASMAHGVEVRVPFVDEELLQATRYLYKNKLNTDLKKDLAKNYFNLPSFIWNRPKTGFGTPIRRWMDIDNKSYEFCVTNEFGF